MAGQNQQTKYGGMLASTVAFLSLLCALAHAQQMYDEQVLSPPRQSVEDEDSKDSGFKILSNSFMVENDAHLDPAYSAHRAEQTGNQKDEHNGHKSKDGSVEHRQLGASAEQMNTEDSKAVRRDLYHLEVMQSTLYGNSTHLQYFYVPVDIGSHRQTQTLILDTGSSIAAMPCKSFCRTDAFGKSSCGKHINAHYDLDRSTAHHIFNCKTDRGEHCDCSRDGNDRCEFYQGYMEGSSYTGFMVLDQVYFGDHYKVGYDAFNFVFGCISKETNLFYTQLADGILGMGKETEKYIKDEVPIWRAMYDQKLIQYMTFSICLGKNGGFLQIGGYHVQDDHQVINWYQDLNIGKSYLFELEGVSVHDHFLDGSDSVKHAFVDSGTTFTYLPRDMWDSLMYHFDYFCEQSKDIRDEHGQKLFCPGERFLTTSQGEQVMCFSYDQRVFEPNGVDKTKEFLMGYPIIKFHAKDLHGKATTIDWYPSEYLYREPSGQMYCLAADKNSDPNQVIFGSTLMRQHQYIFDVQNDRIGVSRANCSKDRDIIVTESDYVATGRTFGLLSARAATGLGQADNARNQEFLSKCQHGRSRATTKFVKGKYSQKPGSVGSTESGSGTSSKFVAAIATFFKILAALVLFIVGVAALIFLKECCVEACNAAAGRSSRDRSQSATSRPRRLLNFLTSSGTDPSQESGARRSRDQQQRSQSQYRVGVAGSGPVDFELTQSGRPPKHPSYQQLGPTSAAQSTEDTHSGRHSRQEYCPDDSPDSQEDLDSERSADQHRNKGQSNYKY